MQSAQNCHMKYVDNVMCLVRYESVGAQSDVSNLGIRNVGR